MAKILLVEDDAMNRDMLSRRLEMEGYQVITAADGAQAISTTYEELPDLILMDMGLPILNGWQATHRLKESKETSDIPIIALTAFAMAEDRLKCLAIGCDEYESKPVDFPCLIAKIQQFLDLPGELAMSVGL